jgi:mono/diheme cytochrome c family protein
MRQQWVVRVLGFIGVWGIPLGGVGAAAGGKEAYQKLCQSCHGADGAGNPQMAQRLKVSIPPVTGAALAQKDEAEMLRIIAEGKGKTPGYAQRLSAAEQQQVLEYMKTLGQR